MAKPKTGVQSGMVRTVLGPIPVDAMGVTLMHEHTLLARIMHSGLAGVA